MTITVAALLGPAFAPAVTAEGEQCSITMDFEIKVQTDHGYEKCLENLQKEIEELPAEDAAQFIFDLLYSVADWRDCGGEGTTLDLPYVDLECVREFIWSLVPGGNPGDPTDELLQELADLLDGVLTQGPPSVVWDISGNRQCDPVYEILFDKDTDGDEIKDCKDPDDDNDLLTDEVEDKVYARFNPDARLIDDIDEDGISDRYDMFIGVPDEAGLVMDSLGQLVQADLPIKLTLTAGYEPGDGVCDPGSKADPYIDNWGFNLVPGVSLVDIPDGWRYDSHEENREGFSPIVDTEKPLVVHATSDIRRWALPEKWYHPAFEFKILMYDHDAIFDDIIDLSDKADAIGVITATLAPGGGGVHDTYGEAQCRATIRIGITNNVEEVIGDVTTAALSKLDKLITWADVESVKD